MRQDNPPFNRTVAAAKLVKEDKGKITKLQVVLAADSSTAEKPLTFPVDAKVVAEAAAMGDKVVLTVVPKMTEVKLSERYPKAAIQFDRTMLDRLLAETGDAGKAIAGKPATLTIIYGCGDFVAATECRTFRRRTGQAHRNHAATPACRAMRSRCSLRIRLPT